MKHGLASHRLLPDLVALTVALLMGLLLWTLAYQVPFSVVLAIGGDETTYRRHDDAPFLHGFNDPEPDSDETWQWWTLAPGYAYRWTESNARIHLPGIGGGRWVVTLLADSGRPAGEAATGSWYVGEQLAMAVQVPAAPRRYRFTAQASSAGDLEIGMQMQPFQPANDPRDLGLVLRSVQITSAAAAFQPPAAAVLGWSVLLLALFVLAFLLMITLSAKKFDRYLLPVFPTLNILAAVGLVGLGNWLAGRLGRRLGLRWLGSAGSCQSRMWIRRKISSG
ncbi:MAG: hypothetical protein HC876_21775 [Chloroflexaceae bacterium]|nr:hypothetical protein [Chloroflexaceae bacterium]